MKIENLSGMKHEEKGLSPVKPIVHHEKIYNEDSLVRMHYHSSYEINICENLRGVINIEGNQIDLKGIRAVLLPPGTLHSYRIESCGGQIKVWHLALSYLDEINSEEVGKHFQNTTCCRFDDDKELPKVSQLLKKIEFSRSLERSSLVLELLGMFKHKNSGSMGRYKNPFLHNITAWAEASYSDPITLDDAADAAHLSRYHFARKFKNLTGSTFMEYLNNLRLEQSLVLLNDGFSVSETSEQSGFSDVSYYIKKFKELYGMTPLKFQQNITI